MRHHDTGLAGRSAPIMVLSIFLAASLNSGCQPNQPRQTATSEVHALLASAHVAEAAVAPDDALRKLQEGNARYVAGKAQHPDQNAARRTELSKEQHPF